MDDGDPIRSRSSSPSDAAARATVLVAAARDDPAERLRLACSFYDQQVAGRSIRPYRRAEVAFMRWQLRRRVLAAPGAAQPGSPWWRAVNETLLRDAAEAALLCDGQSGVPSSNGVRHWLVFLRDPSPQAWYRAHNASIVAGYLDSRHLVAGEMLVERFFMDVALLRVFYAHSLLARPRLALGRLGVLGRFLGDPRRRAADLFLSMQNVLPDKYPIEPTGIDEVLADENYLGRVIDYGVIAPRLELLYQFAADDLDEPRVADLHTEGSPVYAWPWEYRDVWRTGRSRVGIAIVGGVIGHPVTADR